MRHPLIERLTPAQRSLLALKLAGKRHGGRDSTSTQSESRGEEEREFPLSFAQEGIWILDRLAGDEAALNMPAAVRLSGPVATPVLEEAFNQIVRHHEILRTTIHGTPDGPRQIVHPAFRAEIRQTDISSEPSGRREASLQHHIGADARRRFAPDRLPLFSLHMIRTAPDEQVLIVVLHHLIADGWSVGVLIQELNTRYMASLGGSTRISNPLPLKYRQYCVRQKQERHGQKWAGELAYWRDQLSEPPPLLSLTIDKPEASGSHAGDHRARSFAGNTVRTWLSPELTPRIEALAVKLRLTVFMLLFAAFAAAIRSYSRAPRFALGTDVAGRGQHELEGMIGLFTNQVTIVCDVGEDKTFAELAAATSRTLLGAYAHQSVPLEAVLAACMPARRAGANPWFRIKCVMPNVPLPKLHFPGVAACLMDVSPATSKFDLTLFIEQFEKRLRLSAEYATARFDTGGIECLLRRFTRIVEAISEDPEIRVSALLNL